jgi:hypothetical protein
MSRLVRARYESDFMTLEFRGVSIDGGVDDVDIVYAEIDGKPVEVTRAFEWEHLGKADGLEWGKS